MSSGWWVIVLDGDEEHEDHQAFAVMVVNASGVGTGHGTAHFASFRNGRSSIATTGGRT
jgi:hypothetical protein